MNEEFIAVLEYWEKEKGISKDTLIKAVEESLVAAAKKAIGPARDLRCTIDPKNGDIKAWASLIVSENVISSHDQINVKDAKRINIDAQIGDDIEVEVTPQNFGRIAAQYAKQSLLMHVRKAEKALIYDEFKDRTGDIVSGVVRRFERSDVVIDLGRYEALLPNRERVPTEEYQPGERIRCYVKAVENTNYGPEIILSRAAPAFVEKLFSLEVSEISNGTVEIKSIAREPGFRTKLAVYSTDLKVDPVGACVGLRGQRVKNIVRELNNEKMDIIKWDSHIQTYLTNALAPAQLDSFEIDDENRAVKILVQEDQLSLTIGKRGQNARLASRLTGWQVNIEAKQSAAQSVEDKIAEAAQAFAAVPGISPELATTLVEAGFHALEDLTQVEAEDLVDIDGIGEQAASIIDAVTQELAKRDQKLTDSSDPTE
ncbi:MAG: transcription termination/antitermination protein NusA [Verrucomicrobiales bacterium]|nr:transcription termination/antitermination protein NusA [Verrucomicrobiales bacterium]